MLNLEPLITRLVDDVFRAIRGAVLAELREILESSEQDLERKPRPLDPSRVVRPPVKRVPVARATRPETSSARTESRSHPEPEPYSEITDPERLLAHPQAPPPAPAEEVEPPPAPSVQSEPLEPEAEPPSPPAPVAAATPHTAGNAPARLRAGESLANTTGTGMVIRRAKRT
jgi:type IV secretory pathway VirB10-like protein